MTIPGHSLKREVNDLVLEQIFAFKEPTKLDDGELLEYHLRHVRIMTLYRDLDRVGMAEHQRDGLGAPDARLVG